MCKTDFWWMGMGWREWEGEMFIKVSIFYNIIINIYINNYIIKSIEAVLGILKMYLHICTFAHLHTKLLTRGRIFLPQNLVKIFCGRNSLPLIWETFFWGRDFMPQIPEMIFRGRNFMAEIRGVVFARTDFYVPDSGQGFPRADFHAPKSTEIIPSSGRKGKNICFALFNKKYLWKCLVDSENCCTFASKMQNTDKEAI